jgi:CheY-like chemotaxis protein
MMHPSIHSIVNSKLETASERYNIDHCNDNSTGKSLYKILIVDDEADITLTLKLALEEDGLAAVDVFNDPLVALSSFKPEYYDLILLDIKMPKMSGFDLYQELVKIHKKDIKVCFITAFEVYYETLKKDFPELKVGCFINKSTPLEDIKTRIKQEIEELRATPLKDNF